MSMYRQLWLALIISTLLALIGSLFASTLNTRAYLEEQLRLKNIDNAATLALSLNQKDVDATHMELAVAALFDSGHYESIRIIDPAGKKIVERLRTSNERGAPDWFMRKLPIAAPAGVANITDGWKQVGTVSLESNNRFAYHALWRVTTQMTAAVLFAGLLGGYLGTLILRRLKRPLDAVVEQARAISERRFVIAPEPNVRELKQLSSAMNSAVARLKAMFDEEAKRLEIVRREANHDPLTGLANRAYLMAQLRAAVETEETAIGALILIRVANLADINRRLGRTATDDLLKLFGKIVEETALRFDDGLTARLNGAEFGLLLPHAEHRAVANELLEKLVRETSDILGEAPVAFIGSGQFRFGLDFSVLLTQVDMALASAEAKGVSSVGEAAALYMEEAPRSAEQWSQLIRRALEQQWVRIGSFPVADFSGRLIHREAPLRLMFGGDWLPAGRFLPFAERSGLTSELDLSAVRLGLNELAHRTEVPGLAINISASSIQDAVFRQQLRAVLDAHPAACRRLWLEVPESGAFAHLEAFRIFCAALTGTGCRLGLEHFGRQFAKIGLLHDLGLDYLKVDASFVHGIEANAGNQAFLKGLTGMAHNIGLHVFAEGVVSAAELDSLHALGFDGATGPAVTDPT
ncbi:MAG: diguanylate cyclase [Burkholderiales bacterium RIFCSPLOWO2_02_FULL_57_36]|nr:MAG: diguanylate cyclase [Burkholderiales bacterium RIFCSPLOWO2_02_FULL_57_36]